MTACTPTRRGIVCSRLKASRSFIKGIHLHAYPAGAYFCMRKSRQNALGAAPQDPLPAKLRLDTNWTFQQMLKSRSVRRRRYALKVPAAHFMWKLWMVRGRGGWGAGCRLAEGTVLQTIKYLLNCHLSSPPQRRGQGWWFALPRSSAGR